MVAPGLAKASPYTVETFFGSQVAEWVVSMAEVPYLLWAPFYVHSVLCFSIYKTFRSCPVAQDFLPKQNSTDCG